MNFIVIFIYIILTSLGLILFKLGATDNFKFSYVDGILNIKINYLTIFGILSYLSSFALYLGLVSKLKLSYLVPVTTGIMQVVILVASSIIFKETITMAHICGILLVVIGIYLINM